VRVAAYSAAAGKPSLLSHLKDAFMNPGRAREHAE
jgi:hypothetical protein